MASRLGQVLYWIACLIAIGWLGTGWFVLTNDTSGHMANDDFTLWLVIFGGGAALAWGIGRALRYVLGGAPNAPVAVRAPVQVAQAPASGAGVKQRDSEIRAVHPDQTPELKLRRTQSALYLADIAGAVMKAQLGTARRLNGEALKGRAEPMAAFAAGLLGKALDLSGIELTEEAMGVDRPFLVLVQFAKKWLPEIEDHNALANLIAQAGGDEKYDRYFKHGQAAFLRFDANHQDNVSEETITQDTDDLARALGIRTPR